MTIQNRLAYCLFLGAVACSSDEQPAAKIPVESGAPDAPAVTHGDAAKEASKPPAKDAAPATPDAGDAGEAGDGAPQCPLSSTLYPPFLSETGLYADISKGTLGAGVRAYEVHYPLWSDGAGKKRWAYIPPGTKIDTTDMDFWVYPVGMKAWKEFSVGGKRIETRLQYKSGPNQDDWVMIAYKWKADDSDAVALPCGEKNASGTTHDIPSIDDCQFCHGNMVDRLLGFNAIQLSHTLPGLKIDDLIAQNQLTKPPSGPFTLPGTSGESDALGYLHGNCGDCHNRKSSVFIQIDMQLWESTKTIATVQNTNAYLTAVNEPAPGSTATNRIVPGDPAHSQIWIRMGVRGSGQMPPIATEVVDTVGRAKVEAWIRSLPPLTDGGGEAGSDAGGAIDGG
jgi:hypothetical protein